MLKSRTPIITILLSLIAASACHRLPLSIGEGIDDAWHDPDGSGSAGTGTGGGTGGAPGLGECDATYLSCLESGEEGAVCRAVFDQCAGGTAGTGSGGAYPDGTGVAGAGGYPAGGTEAAGAAGTGSGGAYPDGTGVAGAGGYPAGGYPAGGGSAGGNGLDECNTTYVLCLESGEQPEICRDELTRCELIETGTGGAAGASGEAGAGNAAMARD
jgi:hypothetical protein